MRRFICHWANSLFNILYCSLLMFSKLWYWNEISSVLDIILFQKHLGISPESSGKYSSDRRNHRGNRETVRLTTVSLTPPHLRHIHRWTLLMRCISTVTLVMRKCFTFILCFTKTRRDPSHATLYDFNSSSPLLFSNMNMNILCKALLQILL